MEEGVDYYIENGYRVFTSEYHLKRGRCCKNNCRHCPWKKKKVMDTQNIVEWIDLNKQTPPAHTLVWVKRLPNKVEEMPIYLGMRNDMSISTNPDASQDCYWRGVHKNDITQNDTRSLKLNSGFSDVTVDCWAFVVWPKF